MTVKEPLESRIQDLEAHWAHVQPHLAPIQDEDDYERRVVFMDRLLSRATDMETDPRAQLASRIAEAIEAYDEANRPLPQADGREVLAYLMAEHSLTQSDVPEVGGQSVVSEVLNGKRALNWRQVQALADRFNLSTDAFRDA